MLEHIPGLPDLILFWMNDVSIIRVSRCGITRGTLPSKHVLTLIWMIMTDSSFKIVSNWAVLTHEVSTQRLELHSMLPKELESKNIKFLNHSISYKYELSHSSVCTFIYSKSQVTHMVSGSITNMQLYKLSEGNQTIRVRLFYQQGLDLHK